jgi:hypothetical protein
MMKRCELYDAYKKVRRTIRIKCEYDEYKVVRRTMEMKQEADAD